MRNRLHAALGAVTGRGLPTLVVVAVSTLAVVSVLSVSTLFVAHAAFSAVPELPDPGIDVSSIDDLEAAVSLDSSQPSVVVDRDGEVIGRFAAEQTRLPLDEGEIPEHVETALLAAEDDEFYDHGGFSPQAIGRALVRNASADGVEQGGSTITQQLAKNLFTGDEESLERKLQELQVAMDIERHFTKAEILAAYVNSVFLGNGAIGFEAASRTYYGKPAAEMSLSEAALLVGLLPAPSARDPRVDFEAADDARRRVLQRVLETGRAPADVVERALDEVPEVLPPQPRIERFPYYLDYVRRFLLDEQSFDPDQLYRGGLRIETALDPEVQAAARQSIAERLPDPDGPDAALAVVDVETGLVHSIVGGRDFDSEQVNLALGRLGAGSGRQAGSSFKPFVLAAAFEQGFVPQQQIAAPREYLPTTVDDPKPVRNFSQRGYRPMSLAQATIRSINTSFVALTETVGADAVSEVATALGVDGLPERPGPSIGIGAYETSPLAMARAYAGLADDGRRVDVSPVRRIVDPSGEVVADFTPPARDARPQVVRMETARWITAILESNVLRGTAVRALFDHPAAAKTGTSDEYANAWLAGYTTRFATAVWVGHPEGNVSMRNVAGFSRVTGGSIPSQIWHDVMVAAHAGMEPRPFAAPPAPPSPTVTLPGATSSTTTTRPTTTSTTEPTTSTSESTTTTSTTAPSTTTSTRPTTTTSSTTTTTQPTTTTTTTTQPTTTTTSSTTTTTQPTTTTTTQPSTTTTTTTTQPTTTTTAPPDGD